MKMHDCEICRMPMSLILFPDCTASGLWCVNCGVGYANPEISLPDLPRGLVKLIDGWVTIWDFASEAFPDEINKEYFEKLILDMGEELNKQINQYYFCMFDMEKSKLDNPPRVNRDTGKWEHK